MTPFRPKLLDSLRHYNSDTFTADLGAGITVGLVALPLAMAFAIASGVKPENGLFTAIIAGFIISALGGSRVQIGGPAGAFIVIVYGILQQYGLANLIIATMMAGVLLFIMGLIGIGSLIRFIPTAIVIGFTNGIAVLIGLSQVKDALGLDIKKMPADFVGQVISISHHIASANVFAILITVGTLALLIMWPRFASQAGRFGIAGLPGRAALVGRLPATIVALVIATALVTGFGLPVETIGTRFGGIPQSLPALALPAFHWQTVRHLLTPAITIALLCAIESLLCARVADSMIRDRHDPNQELMAQGIANFVAPLFGGIPATGTIARTTTNVRTGGKTPIAGIIHALTLLLILLVAAPLAAHIPLATLAGILLFVAWNMGEWKEFPRLMRFAVSYRAVMLATFILTVTFDLTVAVEVGLALAGLFFIYRTSNLTRIEHLSVPDGNAGSPASAPRAESKGRIVAYKLFGSLFFGTVGKIEELLDHDRTSVAVIILEMHQVIDLDATGLDSIRTLLDTLRAEDCKLVLCGLTAQPLSLIQRSGFIEDIGSDNIVPDWDSALARARLLAA